MNLVPLHAGPVQLALVPEEGVVRWILAGGHEILRGISAPVRDQTWATVRPGIDDLEIEQAENSFRVSFVARCRAGDVDFRWRGELLGHADGTIIFDFDGEALADFRRNRIGFCVLHPAESCGSACRVEHVDGQIEAGRLPVTIQPHQPFLKVRSITHEVGPGLSAEVRFEGDTFEMEDQRNWTDASFKTYGTPLALPIPVAVKRGTRIRQRVTLRVNGAVGPVPAGFIPPWRAPDVVAVGIGQPLGTALPWLGVTWNLPDLNDSLIAKFRALGLSHLRLDLHLADDGYRPALHAGAAAAAQLGTTLELAVFVNDGVAGQAARLRAALDGLASPPRIGRWLVFHETRECTPAACIAAVRTALASSASEAPVGGGATDNFTELNRSWDATASVDLAVYACNPQVHACDDASLIETLGMQGLTASAARRLCGGRPVVVSPIMLSRRWRHGEAGAPSGRSLPFRPDPRQAGGFAAAWMLGSLASLAAAGVASVTYFEATGDHGVLSAEGAARPVCDVFKALAGLAGAGVIGTTVSHPGRVAALACVRNGRRILLMANLSAAAQRVRVTDGAATSVQTLAAYEFHLISLS